MRRAAQGLAEGEALVGVDHELEARADRVAHGREARHVLAHMRLADLELGALEARGLRRQGRNPFTEYQLPQAVLALKQGVGRLIRDPDDRGVVLLADPRLRSKGYGRQFLASLPPMARAEQADEAVAFLREHLGTLAPTGSA